LNPRAIRRESTMSDGSMDDAKGRLKEAGGGDLTTIRA
jgi:hypothetical protein